MEATSIGSERTAGATSCCDRGSKTPSSAPAKDPATVPPPPQYLGDLLFQREGGKLVGSDVVFVLYGCDLGVRRNGGRAGAARGPAAFLRAVRNMRCPLQNPEHGIDASHLTLSWIEVPLADLKLLQEEQHNDDPDPLEEAHRRLTEVVRRVLESGGLPFVVGGGNDQSFANWRGLRQHIVRHRHHSRQETSIGVINIDAHLDVRPLIDNCKAHSGSPFRQILLADRDDDTATTANVVVHTTLCEFAAQGSQCSQEHADFVTSAEGSILWLKDVRQNAPSQFRELIKRQKLAGKMDHGFVSFDLDSIQASDCPGVSCPASTGLTAQDALDIMKAAGEADHVKLVDMSEMNPEIEDYLTPRLAVQMVYHFILGFCCRRSRRTEKNYRLRISHLSQLVCVEDVQKQGFRTGEHMGKLNVIEDGEILVDQDGRIAYAGPANGAPTNIDSSQIDTDLDGRGKAAIPGLCDGHTHPVWAGDRVHEFALKLAGVSYMDIHRMGGGINFTVRQTRETDEETLYKSFVERLDQMNRMGTTLAECKSGYGLDTETELRMLRVIDRAQHNLQTVDVVGNFCGAHSIPECATEEQALDSVINEMIPALAEEQNQGRLTSVRLIDVFADDGVFSTESAEQILKAGEQIGLLGNFHGDELSYQACGELAGKLKCRAVSHLERVSDKGIEAMTASHTAAVLLPTTAFELRITPPPARKLINSGVPVALGSDFNPNAHCLSMPHVMHLSCVTMKMTVEEALVASTLNAAYSMGMQDAHGSLEAGKRGDIVLVAAPRWEHMVYQFGGAPPLYAVVKDGLVRYL